jgi:glycosyltransferase involved in cell wall biosynthesis
MGKREHKKQVILSHAGKQHSYYVARALYELGYLKKFYTSSYISNPALQALISKLNVSFFSRRYLSGLGGKYVSAAWRYEIKELVFRQLEGNSQKVNELVFERDINFDKDLSKKLPRLSFDAFWGFQGSCYHCLKESNALRLESICEMTMPHVPFAKRILNEESALHPEWADSIGFTSFPANYEQRLIEEPQIAKRVIAISSFLKNTLVQEGIEAEKITVIPLGFDATTIPFHQESESVANRPLRLLYVGRVTQGKGIKYLLEAMKSFGKNDVELHIIGNIYGSGAAFKSYCDLYTYSKGVSQAELFKMYKQYDALVLPSIMEGFGLVTIEAMGAGLPVITTPNTNATEVIRNGINGFVVPIRDSNAIANAITTLRNMDDASYQQMRHEARKVALQYTWDTHKDAVAAFIG